jgi:hypothetical protein
LIRLWEVATGKERARFEEPRGTVYVLAFSPDGRRLATTSPNGSLLVWDVTGRMKDGRLAPAKLSPPELETAWGDLGGDDAGKAHRAVWLLAAAPEQALPLLRESLKPATAVDTGRLKKLVAALDDDDFEVREKATQELEELGDRAEAALKKALEGTPSAEVRQRVRHLLDRQRGAGASPERLRQSRALEALVQTGGPEAKRLLEELAQGAADAALTKEAKAALRRIDGRH